MFNQQHMVPKLRSGTPAIDAFRVVSDPYVQGLSRKDAIALVTSVRAPDKNLQARYHRTPHFRALKANAVTLYSTCVICGKKGVSAKLTVHHRPCGYRHLFEENLVTDVVLVCARDHARLRWKG